MSCCDFEHSQISAQDTFVGVEGDDIMFHILVIPIISHKKRKLVLV